ncbi:hypothetical protein CHS0354_040537 [Potamilus streckersoni]|uniref:Uncharacterized protein n=1 Tax=Potamilus streckersoni TaxID=2493646 RepID=A0AAE0T2K5_9BIVA|nr:hypothetical protein CHS0354_040537 [Potamilus streckersoni]
MDGVSQGKIIMVPIHVILILWMFDFAVCIPNVTDNYDTESSSLLRARVPDEQRLYEELMNGYEKSVRPVHNATSVLLVRFGLRLNQIVDLDERHQVLTTNVFIDQAWTDENLVWDPDVFSSIRSIRIPARKVWLPDTFIYNNADDGSTGFMQGTYVLVDYNGTVLWPVPVKLKSSCKVDITYFPFDDQKCILRFGSWIYSGLWMDYVTMHHDRPIDLGNYVNNSEWDLLSVILNKNIRTHSCCPDPHPDLTYLLHIRRKTFYYIFNIIVPCIMLSILTLLTFWLPPTSGEKITLGLSVFLAFSMFMLLIAEEVPATSEAVPLIGIYLCVVMTMTSLSVIMAVMVINVYNRGTKARRAPPWVRKLVLDWMSRPLGIRHDLERLVQSITLDNDHYTSDERKPKQFSAENVAFHGKIRPKPAELLAMSEMSRQSSIKRKESVRKRTSKYDCHAVESLIADTEREAEEEQEVVWLRREDFEPEHVQRADQLYPTDTVRHGASNRGSKRDRNTHTKVPENRIYPRDNSINNISQNKAISKIVDAMSKEDENSEQEMYYRKMVVAEWQRIAAVIDRVLFWIYFLGTIASYVVILIIIPGKNYSEWDAEVKQVRAMQNSQGFTLQ